MTALKRLLLALVIVLLAAVVGGTSAQAQGSAGAEQSQAPTDSPVLSDQVIEAGRATFHGSGTCHACHGDDLRAGRSHHRFGAPSGGTSMEVTGRCSTASGRARTARLW
jgi:mono/diheme cytochrome c family protein